MTVRIGVIGDLHGRWGEEDLVGLGGSGYDALLFTGDLGGRWPKGSIGICRSIARLPLPTFVIPGNHDGPSLPQLVAEVLGRPDRSERGARRMQERVERLQDALSPHRFAGYCRHPLAEDLELIAGRPHSMGGDRVGFARFIERRFGVGSMQESAERLRTLVQESGASRLVFLAHNGPLGLGAERDDPFGCDFRPERLDFGDPDLAEAVLYARRIGKRVLAVVAGHMHHKVRGGGTRRWLVEREGTLYVNAARVPRVFRRAGRRVRHHVELVVDGPECRAREVLLEG